MRARRLRPGSVAGWPEGGAVGGRAHTIVVLEQPAGGVGGRRGERATERRRSKGEGLRCCGRGVRHVCESGVKCELMPRARGRAVGQPAPREG